MRLYGNRNGLRVEVLLAKEHELCAPHRAPFAAGRDTNALVEGLCFEPKPLTLDRLDVLRAPNQGHIVSGAGEHAAVVAAHRARTHYSDFHRRSPRQHDFTERPILDTMAQAFARLAEGIGPLDDRPDRSVEDQREDIPLRGGDHGR